MSIGGKRKIKVLIFSCFFFFFFSNNRKAKILVVLDFGRAQLFAYFGLKLV